MTAQPRPTLKDFIVWEQRQEGKHEYAEGGIVAFAGGTTAHHAIASRLIQLIGPHAAPCLTLGSDALVETARSARYADVVVTCDERDKDPGVRSIRYPKLIVEVLSESTAAIDRGEKLDEYRSLESLMEYVLIDSRKRWAETYRREGSQWIASLPIVSGNLQFEAIGLSIALEDLCEYAGIVADPA